MKKYLILISVSLIFISGIIRHDVDESEYTKLANQPEFDCVGLIIRNIDSMESGGSCVAINKRFILTAAHVLFDVEVREDTMVLDGNTWVVYNPVASSLMDVKKLGVKLKDKVYTAKSIRVHSMYNDTSGNYDYYRIERRY
jgi:hypothetical protein